MKGHPVNGNDETAVATVGADKHRNGLEKRENYSGYHGEVRRKERRMHGDREGGSGGLRHPLPWSRQS